MMFFQAVSTKFADTGGGCTGAVSLKRPHHIITLRFSEAVKDHAK